jgi:hypothetical protein
MLNTMCPYCTRKALKVRGEPLAGDYGLCLGCGEGSVFTWRGGLRKPSREEAARMHRHPGFHALKVKRVCSGSA